jgi:hypothetical protein
VKYKSVQLPGTGGLESLNKILPHVNYVESGVGGKPTIQFSGVNVQVVNGEGSTDTTNGEGNIVIGYDTHEVEEIQTGSHNLVLGNFQEFTSYGGIVGGNDNIVTAPDASVIGGSKNTVSGPLASVTGGERNTASGFMASVSGGGDNSASGEASSIGGGVGNRAEGRASSISGGLESVTTGEASSIFGGSEITATNELEACGGFPTKVC